MRYKFYLIEDAISSKYFLFNYTYLLIPVDKAVDVNTLCEG